MSPVEIKKIKYRNRRVIGKQRKYYENLAVQPDYSKKYIYVALHCYPEDTIPPMGSIYSNQCFVVDILKQNIPEDWHIYVKENRVQFYPINKHIKPRSRMFYNYIHDNQNVSLVDIRTPQFDLIDNSQAVATLIGTTGWEAVNRGKPAIIFGNAWYRGCEGVFCITSNRDCKNAIDSIVNGYAVEYNKVKKFAYAAEQVCVRAAINPGWARQFDITYDENVRALTSAIQNKLVSEESNV